MTLFMDYHWTLWITRCIRMVLHMEIHKLRWKSIYMDYHLSLWISIWISRQMHMVIHKFGGNTYNMDYHINTINNYAFPYGFPWKYIWNMYFHLVIHMKTWNYIFFFAVVMYLNKCEILGRQDQFSRLDLIDNEHIPFTDILDKGY